MCFLRYMIMLILGATFLPVYGQPGNAPAIIDFPVDCSIRVLQVLSEDHVWFAGSGGTFGYTTTGGQHWTIDSILFDGKAPEFRALAVTDKAVFLLSVASPAYLLRSFDHGKNWEMVYRDDHPDIFFDSMKFWDDENGIAMGDPVDGCLSVIITTDGGDSWNKLDCSNLPSTFEGEAAFAASNTNIVLYGQHAWLVTGGTKARVFHTPDRGLSWEVFDTPVVQGEKMTGIFSADFYNEYQGIIFGGDWENQSKNTLNKAVTKDGGRTWELVSDGLDPGYRSCVQYIPGTNGQGVIATGIPGISYSSDAGVTWQFLGQEYYYTIRMAPSGKTAWLAGRNKIAKMQLTTKN